MRFLQFISIIVLLVFFASCRKDFDTIRSSGNLSFSRDTVFLDTVFTNIGSSTRSFKVYNRGDDAITIPTITLGRGENSFYRLNVDGVAGKSFKNIDILAKDSIFVFVEATIDFEQVSNPIYTDSVVFDEGNNLQDVDLVTLVQDAHFWFPRQLSQGVRETVNLGVDELGNEIVIDGFLLEDDTTWQNDKPHVVYGYVAVPQGRTLTIEAGTKVNFHADSGILIQEGGSLKVNGALENEVLFEGDRLEPEFSEIPGQWGTIWLRSGSINNEIDYAIIKNGIVGLLVDNNANADPTLSVSNTQIYNTSNHGILGRAANIKGENLVIGNNGQSSVACTAGGIYNFAHCTFANYWSSNFRQLPALLLNNFFVTIENGSEVANLVDLQEANFTNCIIDGNQNIEFILDRLDGADFNFKLSHSMLRFNTSSQDLLSNPLYDFTNALLYENIIRNGIPDYRDIDINDFIIGEESGAIGNASLNVALTVPLDILGIDRTVAPDIGAYQHIIFDDQN